MVVRMHRSERGVSLMETLVALFILSVVGVASIVGVGTTVKINELARTRIAAESLARTELEYVSSQSFAVDWTYTLPSESPTIPVEWTAHSMPEGYTGYSITVTASDKESYFVSSSIFYKQKITAVVKDAKGNVVLTIETYQAKYGG